MGLVFALWNVPKVQPEVLRELLALVPPQWTAPGPQQCRIFIHFLNFDLDHLLVADCDPLKLEFVTRLRTALQYDLGVMHIHDLGCGKLGHLFRVGLLLIIIHLRYRASCPK